MRLFIAFSLTVKGIVLKLDFAKAFDTVKWDFLFHTLIEFGFPTVWVNWLQTIFSSAKMSVLVNGSPTNEFQIKRGLRQGDPLSPLLFNIVAEILHLLLEKAEHLGLLRGIKLGSGPTISYLQFADDTIIFTENTMHSCKGIKVVLKIFELLSGLEVNFKKSFLFTSKEDCDKAQEWSEFIGCGIGTWPLSYLGANLGSSPK